MVGLFTLRGTEREEEGSLKELYLVFLIKVTLMSLTLIKLPILKSMSSVKESKFPFKLMRTMPQLSSIYTPFILQNSFKRLHEHFLLVMKKKKKLDLWGENIC